jgi:hypothetical protein
LTATADDVELPIACNQAPFLGNGMLGTVVV